MIIGKRKKLIIFIIVAIAAVATLICLIMWQSGEESGVILSTIALFACLEVIAVCISFFVSLRIDKEWGFCKHGIVEKREMRNDRLIPYKDIRAIAICSAVDRNFFPICDENDSPLAVIMVYDNWSVPRSVMRPDSIVVVPTVGSDALSYSFYSPEKLSTLLKNTAAMVFISQKEYRRNQAQLRTIFEKYQQQILISVSNDPIEGRFVEFSEYKE